MRILFAHSRRASFIRLDRDVVAARGEVDDLYQPGRWANPLSVLRRVRRADVVVGWWASWHTFWPFLWARLLRRPSLLIVGGFDTAREPEIGYGYQLGGARARLSRAIMRWAGVLVTNSEHSRTELAEHCGIPPERVRVVHHGLPDPWSDADAERDRDPLALSVAVVVTSNLRRKGLAPFVAAGALVPDAELVLAGRHDDPAAVAELESVAAPNVRLTGWVEDDELRDLYARASVYVQASWHEGFGMAVVEAMLAGCIPVVSDRGALPEVTGDVGVVVAPTPEGVADGIRRGIELARDPARRLAARRHAQRFPLSARHDGIGAALDAALER